MNHPHFSKHTAARVHVTIAIVGVMMLSRVIPEWAQGLELLAALFWIWRE